jgi:uroporphyrin-III C-methyltransferase
MPPEITGRVRLVGAGPGAADLLTVRALRAIEGAQALLYDALVSDEVVGLAPPGCVRIQTGKRGGRVSMKQSTINALMLRLARRGLDVVRLKGGDPSVFGRVGEEQAFLHGHGIETETIPGVTAVSAAAAQFGLPLTHRDVARRLVITTARLGDGAVAADWAAGADPEATLAIYMGADSAAAVSERLIAAGRDPSTPVLAVENAGRDDARCFRGTVASLAQTLAHRGSGPVVIIVGEVAALSSALHDDAALARPAPEDPSAEAFHHRKAL